MAATIKVTPDSQLATPEAIKNRITQLQATQPQGWMKRVEGLRARLPRSGETVETAPRISPALLASSKDREGGYSYKYSSAF